ncbi:leucine-rich repeat extensin-like protein 5 [Salvia splendens]|uniref:leucine-rich repeat extensin-like protein 5 n=1 Tax=Salvia splendens TaxID=180675 RepID=UPI001C257F0F|nr:leucine-rich repeat extensin-like protein 5 [Salvia splendens]
MLIKQIPASSSSSDVGAESGDRETSIQAHTENPNPSTPITPSPQTSAAAPPPAVDEETLRRLDKILRSIPSELDDAAAYAVLKAKLGISRSKGPTSPSEIKILPSSPISPSPTTIQPSPPSLPKTTSTAQPPPTFPIPSSPTSPPPSSPIQQMQTSEDTSDKEGWGENYGQPFAIPSPGSSGASTSIHEPQLTKGSDVNDEEVEDLRPLFDYGEAEREEGPPLR